MPTPKQVPVQIHENSVMTQKLQYAIVVEDEQLPVCMNVTETFENLNLNVVCLSSLSPYKIIVFLEDEMDVKEALDEKSPLRNMFSAVRKWTDDEFSKERLVWIECFGLHPKCWGHDNFSLIGNRWGTTVRIELDFYGLNSLTSVRLLVRAKSHKRIDECVQVQWESGTGVVWVRELDGYVSKAVSMVVPTREEEQINNKESDVLDVVNMEKNNGINEGIRVNRLLENTANLDDIIEKDKENGAFEDGAGGKRLDTVGDEMMDPIDGDEEGGQNITTSNLQVMELMDPTGPTMLQNRISMW
ncbi:unnamed protein product [Amaranthus hypochondriacus]